MTVEGSSEIRKSPLLGAVPECAAGPEYGALGFVPLTVRAHS